MFAVHRFAQGAADWRSGPRWTILSVLCPVHPFPLRGTSPQGKTRDMREKTASHILQVPPFGAVRHQRGVSHRRWLITVVLTMPYDTESKSRNVLASPLGEEGHEVAKGCTRVRMNMILYVDVTAERRHYNTHRPRGQSTTLGPKGRCPLSASDAQNVVSRFPFRGR